ncbi:hypothetical protein ACFO1V_12765 [Daeguia caeni]|uniref:Uncharacterized protein n=1 Tax=Daeguia caeni TaxID=439612 RepID=A0ABV9H8T6_9HYPH
MKKPGIAGPLSKAVPEKDFRPELRNNIMPEQFSVSVKSGLLC